MPETANMLASLGNYLFFFLPAAGSMLLVYGIYQVVVESQHGERRRVLDRLRGTNAQMAKAPPSILRQRIGRDAAQDFVSAAVSRLSFTPKLQTMLDQANVNWSAPRMLVNLCGAAVAVTVILLLLKFSVIASLGCGAAVFGFPLVFFSIRRKQRMAKLTGQLPDVFEMMSQALRAGHSLASAIQLVHEQLPDPVSSEFGRVYHEQNLGIKIEDALLAMANRVDSLDVRFFVTAVLIQRQTGGDLAEVLDKIGGVIRQRIELFGLVKGLTAEGRLSGWVLFALPFVVFAAVLKLNPDYANVLLKDPTGKMMLLIALGMQLMGLAMIRWIVNIKV
ncbi:MAG TPA: type II secretion system F family protein [Phycisphaerae bacterium]|nr:type II secretion system F family protein [Phycisphaerae bacterium]